MWLALSLLIIQCAYITSIPCRLEMSSSDEIIAYCSDRGLTKFPDTWSADVKWLDLSHNFLTSLTDLSHPQMAQLLHLDVSYNSVKSLPKCTFCDVLNLQHLNLASNKLSAISEDAFMGLQNLTNLILTNNGIHTLPYHMLSHVSRLLKLDLGSNLFQAFPTEVLHYVPLLQQLNMNNNAVRTLYNDSLWDLNHLQVLYLQGNSLTSFQAGAFSSVSNLRILDISNNQLRMDSDSFPPDIFRPLKVLSTLLINRNDRWTQSESYPDVFGNLHALQSLSIDIGSQTKLGTQFMNLTSLGSLALLDECHMKAITNQSFISFRDVPLKVLQMGSCPLFKVDTCAFCGLRHLNSLSVYYSKYLDMSSLLMSLYGLQNQTMDLLMLVNNRRYPVILDRSVTAYLNNICVSKLDLRNNNIVGMTATAFQTGGTLLKCLKHIDLSFNALQSLKTGNIHRFLMGLNNLESLTWANQKIFTLGKQDLFRHSDAYEKERPDVVVYMYTPPSVKYVNLSAGINNLSRLPRHVHFLHADNLTTLSMAYNRAYDCQTTLTGLNHLRTFDFSGNDCSYLSEGLFRNISTLTRLRLAEVHLTQAWILDNGAQLMSPLVELEELDISDNHLSQLPPDFLSHMPHLQRLVLSGNSFDTLPLDVLQHPHLTELDLTNNLLPLLQPLQTQALDSLAANHTFTLKLHGNPLICTCQGLPMISWLAHTNVKLDGHVGDTGYDDDYDDNGRDYSCMAENGSLTSTRTVLMHWEFHWRSCIGPTVFAVAVVGFLLQMISLLLAYLLSSRWTYFKHVWNVVRHLQLPQRQDFIYDALLVHADDDLLVAERVKKIMLSVCPKLRLELTEDAILPGSFLADQLPECIERSWKVVLVLTENFLLDEWSGFTVLHAQSSVNDVMPHRVQMLFVGQLDLSMARQPTHVSMRRLLQLVMEKDVYHIPPDVPIRHPVWTQLTQAIVCNQ